ncbi:hypothetical protein AB5I41_22230 [Sphingomonas sp. MMS24-JH45]
MLAGLATGLLFTAGCTTTRGDVWNARQNLRDAQMYGDRRDVRDARRDLRETRRAYRRDNCRGWRC